jgi:cyclopropane fatty-acyl-phospholipid synthase-like methyltransferase
MSVATSPEPVVDVRRYEPRVVNCYTLFDKFFPTCGMLDYTEGMYFGDRKVPYETAQLNQINYVLDEVGCIEGQRILEVGCGNGNLLEVIRRRGAHGVGITISPEQTALCRARGLDVRTLDYKLLDEDYFEKFDAVVANGPIEHFVQARDAARGLTDDIYRRMFDLFHRAIDPNSSNRRYINTTIHFLRTPDPAALLASPWSHKRGSDAWHWAWLARAFGGFYPTLGQFERLAQGRFRLIKTLDGTEDYHWTSEEWLMRVRAALKTWTGVKIFCKSIPFALRHAKQTYEMLTCMLGSESWNWQFRGPNAPTCLLRQTWDYVPA